MTPWARLLRAYTRCVLRYVIPAAEAAAVTIVAAVLLAIVITACVLMARSGVARGLG